MTIEPRTGMARRASPWLFAATALAVASIGWALFSTLQAGLEIGASVLSALSALPTIVTLHFVQLLLSALAWRRLLSGMALLAPVPGLTTFFRLRIMREGIDSLMPVAQVGGEIIALRCMTMKGVNAGQGAASLIIDVALEVISQLLFLLAGVAVLVVLSTEVDFHLWLEVAGGGIGFGIAVLLGLSFGALRLLEFLLNRIADRFPTLAGLSVAGLHSAATETCRRPRLLISATGLQLLAWSLGSFETWLVLHALGTPATMVQSLVIESLGMAARSAGFAVPGAMGIQEGGFMLAAAAVGLPSEAALALSLVKRIRELVVGSVGLAIWRLGP